MAWAASQGRWRATGQLKPLELETEKFPGFTMCLILWLHVLPAPYDLGVINPALYPGNDNSERCLPHP